MRYLENLALENLTKEITNRELGGGLIVQGRCETYSTRKDSDEMKPVKSADVKSNDGSSSSKSNDNGLKTKKVLGDLIQTMNDSMLDYDFSELSPASFKQVSVVEAVQDINIHLAEITVSSPSFLNNMWRDISEAMISLPQCEAYKLVDGMFIDEVESGTVWSFNYFFCNKDIKRVLYFTCMATAKYRRLDLLGLGGGDSEMDDDEEDSIRDDRDDGDGDMDASDGGHDSDDTRE
ncbi:Maf1 regulator-domain-containing protein [Ochromonadaceae sp. CCMP2298]|nr:Maf1 regulator-domain-containing protein [Ochromonadaceae sp. CCMP2298]|mmetsp:Transcript_30501/g.67430  ORF Transcript_30501/g.67430 Transcript_30501/m.67430 type:complete len:235 (-) Transcript_30501:219-923(-)|eukprot:CAMPEP_0173253996 /NCGR_PEP_ID=MMETSP1142-20121109/21660_1 /TAXON_ID=483371 /ORGANISM="non described non described, Strain CCMP2298" /LENGTH=234 /DNA_ID=CAMNT_0014187347 /DNA_START=69 /DNA_END=773 /DNA_ORIENTATION=-